MLRVCVGAVLLTLTAQVPQFKSGIDLVTIDVVVLDKSGSPVSSLTANDFTVVAGNKPRRIVAADFVRSTPPSRSAEFRTAPAPSSNRRIVAPRTLIFLVDVEQIPSGGGRNVMKGIGDYLDRLGADDRVGVMTLSASPVAPTTNRATVREAVNKIVGTSPRLRAKEMTFGEAPGIAMRDRSSLMAYWRRIADQGEALPGDQTCSPPSGFDAIMTVSQVCVKEAEAVIERVRYETRRVLGRLGEVAQAMDTVPDPKAIVLVSGGLFADGRTQNDFLDFASVAERARVPVMSLFVEPEAGAAGASNSDTRRLDSAIGFGGLVDVASLSRGSAQRLIGDPTPALARLDRELSGHYVLSFERDPTDRDGARMDLDVRTRRADSTVLTRKGVTPSRPISIGSAAGGAASDPKTGIAALLKSGAAVSGIPMAVDAVAMPANAAGQDARIVLAVEVGRNADGLAALGFQFANATGRVIGDGYQSPVPLRQVADGRSVFMTGLPATDGKFIVRVAAIDASGQRGSLQHTFEVAPWTTGDIRLSDLMFGDLESGEFIPGAGSASAKGTLGVRLVIRDQSSRFDDVKVKIAIASAANAGPVDLVEASLLQTPDPVRKFADAKVDVSYYPPGEYVFTATVTARGAEVGKRHRVFVR